MAVTNKTRKLGDDQQTVYQQALAAQPQRYTFWNAGRSNDGWKIDNANAATWQQIQRMYDSGDTAGAMALVNDLSGKGAFGGYYDDKGNYTGFVQGYTGSANASYQPAVGGRLISSGKTDTNIWLTPDGKALNGTTGGALTDNGSTWSRYQPNRGTGWSWKDAQEQNGMNWGDAYAIRAAHGDFTNPELNTPEGNARKLETLYEQPGGISDEEWAKYISRYDPNYAAEIAKYAGTSSGGSSGSTPSGTYPSGQTPYQQALGFSDGADGRGMPTGQNPYMAALSAAPTFVDPYQQERDAALKKAQAMEWNYDPSTDPVWQALQKQYRREGRRAAEDTLGRYAAMTGGMASTAAVTAASQAGDRYAAELSDRLPQVYQDAYNRYLQEYQRQLGISDQYAQFGNTEYDRYQGALNQWNRDRSFGYQQQRDAISDQRYDQEWAQKLREYADSQNWKATEWDQYLREYGDKLSQQEREWAYQQMRDSISDQRYTDETAYSRALKAAEMGAKYGDYSGMNSLGIDTSALSNASYAYAADGSTYDFSTPKAQSFVDNAPAGATMRGSDGSIWRKDQYGGIIIEKNGKTYTYSNPVIPEVKASGYKGSGSGGGNGSGSKTGSHMEALREKGPTTYADALDFLMSERGLTYNAANSMAKDYIAGLGNSQGSAYADGDVSFARDVVSGKYQNADPAVISWAQRVMSETAGMQFGGGNQGEQGNQAPGYRNLDESLGRMISRGASRDEIYAEIAAEVRDGNITKTEGEALKEKYFGQTDNISNNGQYHSGGRPQSQGFNSTMQQAERMASMGNDQVSVGALSDFLMEAYNTGKIHEYEIDIILDRLGF